MSDSNNSGHSAESLTEELMKFCRCESLSDGGLREIIERHGCEPNNNPNIDYKFFRAACHNERVNEGIIRCLLEYFPDSAGAINDNNGYTPLHYASWNKNITLNIVQLLIDAAPTSVRSITNDGDMPLHVLCDNKNVDETAARKILKLLIEKHPEALRHANNNGVLPIHFACGARSPEFCRVLIEAYPGSERIANSHDMLPLHCACFLNNVAVVEYLYRLYPDAINHATKNGRYPIHAAIVGMERRDNPAAAVDVVKYLLGCNVKLQKIEGTNSSLCVACEENHNDSNIEAFIQVIEVIYDAHPDAIEGNDITSNIRDYHHQVQTFINSQLVYSRQARNHRLMMTPDKNGRLPLHTALQNDVRLGSIKLLVKGNPSAVQSPDNSGALPLHIACQHHESASVFQYLVELDTTTLKTVDRDGNTALHYACRGANYDTIALLLEKYEAVSVSERNAQKKLPIDLLFESNEVLDRESVEYTESIFRLLRAYPEAVLNNSTHAKQQSSSAAFKSSSGKKRKFKV
jgi:ankyrin repeat protein